jgi:hypothetical protein
MLKIQADWIGLTMVDHRSQSGGDKLQQIWDHERPKAEPCRASPLFGRQKSRYLDPTDSSPTQVDEVDAVFETFNIWICAVWLIKILKHLRPNEFQLGRPDLGDLGPNFVFLGPSVTAFHP